MCKISYAELEDLNKGKDIPYAYSDLDKTIGEADDIRINAIHGKRGDVICSCE